MAKSTAREDLNSIAPPKSPVTPEYLDAIRFVESNNQHIDPKTKRLLRSSAGAEGAYQIKPNTGRQPGFGVRPVRNNTEAEHRRFAEDYLNAMWRRYGDKALMTVAYNQGPGTVDQALQDAKKAGTTWYSALKQAEGRDYLVKVMGTGAIPSLAQAQTPSVVAQAQAPEQDMSRPVTANPSILRQGERMRDQRPLTSAPKVSLTPLQQFGVDNVGAGFQAALGFSMLGASGRGLPTAEQNIKEEEEADAEMAALEPTDKQASASLQSIPAFDAFAAQRQAQPVQLAEGGSLNDLGDDTGVVSYNPVVESTPTAPTPPKLNLRRQTASKAMSQIPAADGTSGKKSKAEKEAAKGTARQQLQELQYKTGLTSLAIKDKLLGLGENTLGAPTFTRRGALDRGPLTVTSFDKGGEAKKNPLGVAAKMLDTFNEYGKKAEEYGVKARDFLVANGISPTDIATGFMKLKSGVPFGLATYSGNLNEGEDEQFRKMMQQPKPVPVPSPKHFAWGGQAALGNYYNPTTKSYTNTPPMMANPNYTTQKYYERGPSGNYAESKDPFKAAGPVYGYTPAVAGTEEIPAIYGEDEYTPGTPGTPGTPESYAEISKPTENWNKQEIIDPNSGYVSTTGGVVPTNNSLPNWAPPVARVEQPVIVPTNSPNIAAPVVRDNPYAMPAPPAATAKPNPWEPGGEVRIPEDDWNEQMYSSQNFKKTKEYQDYVKSQEGGMQTQDMYDSPYFGEQTSGSYGRGLDEVYKKWAGSNIKPPAAPADPDPRDGPIYTMPITPPPGSYRGEKPPANNAGINAPVVRDNPYAMPTDPVPRAEGSPETGETGAAYGNPAMLAAGEKMRARKALEQVDRADKKRIDDVLDRANMRRHTPETIGGPPSDGPKTLDEAAGLDPKVDRSTFLPYSKKEGWHVPSAAADLMKLATASDPRYSHLMQPEDAVPLAMNIMGGGMGASMATRAAGPGTLGMFIGPSSRMWREKSLKQAEKMEADGHTPQEIWQATLTARAPWDNMWRQRISDISMNMTGEKIPHENPLVVAGNRAVAPFVNAYKDVKSLVKTGRVDPQIYETSALYDRPKLGPKNVSLAEQVSWPRLQNAYPGLLESIIVHQDRKIHPKTGYHDQRNVLTEVAPGDFKKSTQSIIGMGKEHYEPAGLFSSRLKSGEGLWDPKSVLAHEGMHDIQNKEGFSLGASPEWAVYKEPNRYTAALHQKQLDAPSPNTLDKFLEKHTTLRGVLPATKREKAMREAPRKARYSVYENVGGEAEARLVQAELGMSQAALNAQYPYDPQYFKKQTGVDIDAVFPINRAGGSPKEGERSVGDRLVGYGETAASLLSGLGAGIPAGYSGLMELAKTRDSEKAAEEVGRVQKELTYEPRTKSGKKSLESAAELLENLNIPAQYVGDKAFEASGNSPLAGAAAQTLLDPLNFIPGAKGLAKQGKKGVQKALKNAAIPGDSFFAGPLGKQRGAVKPYKGTFARNSPEFLDEKENLVVNKRPDLDYISNLEKYYATARKEVEDAAGMFEGATPEQKLAMREFYDNKAMPYFEEWHGTLRDPVFESLMEGRITPYGGSNMNSTFRPYLINSSKRKEAPNSGIRYPKDEDAYKDITQRYDAATGLKPTLYYPNEQNLINAATKNAPLGRFPVLTDDNLQVIPNKPLSKVQAEDAEKTRTADFINKQMETQQEALVPKFKNQYLNLASPEVKEPSSLWTLKSENPTRAALSDMERRLSGEPATELRQNLNPIEWAKNILTKTPEKNKQGNTVSDKMLESMTRNEPIWDIGSGTRETYSALNFMSPEHLNDYMRTLPPEKIRGMNFTQMVEESSKHQAYKSGVTKLVSDIVAGRSVDPKVFSRGMSEPIKTYEDGFRWVKANDENALKLNGTSVGHCLQYGAANCSLSGQAGGTGRKSFDSGDTEIYFLQDKRGVPVTTVEVINAKDPTKRTISQTKGNGTKTGDTAPVNYDSMVYDFAKQLNPVNISEGPKYLSPMMKELQKTLKTPPPELPFKRGGAVSAARLLKDMPRTEHAY